MHIWNYNFIMKQKLLSINADQIDKMISLKWGKNATTPEQTSYASYSVIGQIFGIDGSSARRLILKWFQERNSKKIRTRKQAQLE